MSLGINKTCHSFRHAMRDRLRAAGTPEDIMDAIDRLANAAGLPLDFRHGGVGRYVLLLKPPATRPFVKKSA